MIVRPDSEILVCRHIYKNKPSSLVNPQVLTSILAMRAEGINGNPTSKELNDYIEYFLVLSPPMNKIHRRTPLV
jgi:hypothetical protein